MPEVLVHQQPNCCGFEVIRCMISHVRMIPLQSILVKSGTLFIIFFVPSPL